MNSRLRDTLYFLATCLISSALAAAFPFFALLATRSHNSYTLLVCMAPMLTVPICFAMAFAIDNNDLLKRLAHGNAAIHGTWIGIMWTGKEHQHIIEVYTQTVNGIQVVGQSYELNGRCTATWASKSVHLDHSAKKLWALLETKPVDRDESVHGIADLTWAIAKRPSSMRGSVQDKGRATPFVIKNMMRVPPRDFETDDDLLAMARERFSDTDE